MENTVVLPKILTINEVDELLKKVRAEVANTHCITLDAKDVEEMDSLGLQLILSIEKTAVMNGCEFKLINAQDRLKNALGIY